MQTRFLLGPAGAGKTFRCLDEIRAALTRSAEGFPLILIAPKQATFQLERRLLAEASLAGYTRLKILSLDRLAEFVLNCLQRPVPRLLEEEGRVMVLRALLARRRDELQLFRASARLPGFAQQLGLVLRELQRFQISSERLRRLAATLDRASPLPGKLHDVALLLDAYRSWLEEHGLQDADGLLDLATEALGAHTPSRTSGFDLLTSMKIDGLWLDGFAEMTPQELNFLAALLPLCRQATMAFCLDAEPKEELSWLSTWSVVSQTFRRCHERLASVPGCESVIEVLPRVANAGRFARNPILQHLEKSWANPAAFSIATHESGHDSSRQAVRVVTCASVEAEVTLAAREILRFVRAGGRYSEAAILLRRLEGYDQRLSRILGRFQIPFFLDRREHVAHHPMAELTRFALRTVTFGWQLEDWLGALKTGLVHQDDTAIDRLENEALARGWKGTTWTTPIQLPDDPVLAESLERLRQEVTAPFMRLSEALTETAAPLEVRPDGSRLATALSGFWNELHIARKLEDWASSSIAELPSAGAVHSAVWRQMHEWLDNLELAFGGERMALREWLPILEAGLAGLTVGVIPPALDQVLIGTIDRSRNPDLKLALVLGMNESVFPASPGPSNLLTEADRAILQAANVLVGPGLRQTLGHERYYGYIACTRARDQLVLTWAERDSHDRALNASPFLSHVKGLFPELEWEHFSGKADWAQSEHAIEMLPALLENDAQPAGAVQQPDLCELARLPIFAQAMTSSKWRLNLKETLSPALSDLLFGETLQTSVSRIEEFAACPFKFFVSSGLNARERERFELDLRERGSFQHDVLAAFHEQLRLERKEWRDLTPIEARRRIATIASGLEPTFRGGLLRADDRSRFTARSLAAALENFMATVIAWMPQYEFNPRSVELAFGLHGAVLPAWELPLDERHRLAFRGKIDRVDLWTTPGSEAAFCVVIDYKSSAKKIDPTLLANGVQMQLPAYLNVLRNVPDAAGLLGVKQLIPAGVFYVNLRGRYEPGKSRRDVLTQITRARARAYQHTGRFDRDFLRKLDNRGETSAGDQFNYRFTAKGDLHKNSAEAMESQAFVELLSRTETILKDFGRQIFSGKACVDPYQRGGQTPCGFCEYQPICRIDPWTHVYRLLREPDPVD